MTANRSLDEFAGGPSDGGEPRAGAEPAAVEAATDAAEPDDAAPEPIVSTYHFTPDGEPCAGCGEAVSERWRQGEDLVCAACKEW